MLLITQTLLSAWNYAMGNENEDAYFSFLDALHRVKHPPTEAMQNGIDFETEVYRVARGGEPLSHPEWENGIRKTAAALVGAPTQIKLSRPITVDGTELLVYGILDAMKAGIIYDVKYSNTSFGSAYLPGKYLSSPQHPAYFYLVPEAYRFDYLVSDGKDLYTESYTPKNSRPFREIASEFLSFLRAADLMSVYEELWKSK
nr:MAG TPA: hypothetical protein [Caudoviricetes sp.]